MATKKDINCEISDESLTHLLNFILSMLQEDRTNALQHHDTLSTMLGGPAGAEGMTGLELQLLVQDLSAALTGFIKNSAQSTDQAIKVAQIMAGRLAKINASSSLTEDDRAEIEETIQNLNIEKDKMTNVIKMKGA